MAAENSHQAENQNKFTLPVMGDHPADLLDGAGAVLGCLQVLFTESNNHLGLNERETYGLCLILGGIQDSVDRAAKML